MSEAYSISNEICHNCTILIRLQRDVSSPGCTCLASIICVCAFENFELGSIVDSCALPLDVIMCIFYCGNAIKCSELPMLILVLQELQHGFLGPSLRKASQSQNTLS